MTGCRRWMLLGALVGAGLGAAGCQSQERPGVSEGRGDEAREGRVNDSQDLASFGRAGEPAGTGGSGMTGAAPPDGGTKDAGTVGGK